MSKFDVPGWSTLPLRELIERKFTGPSPTCEERPIASSEEWGILKTTAVTWSGWNDEAHKVPPRQFWGNESIEVRQGDVLVTKAGPRHRVGVVVHVRSTRPHLMVSGKMIGLRPRTSLVLPSVLAGLLTTQEVQDYLNSRTTGMAESQTNFADEALLKARLNVPSVPEQRQIAEILDTLDAQIKGAEARSAKMRRVKQGLLNDLLPFEIPLDGDLHDSTRDAVGLAPQLDSVAEHWEIGPLGDWLAENPKNGYSPIAASDWTGTLMLGLGCLTHRGFLPSQLKNAPRNDPDVTKTLLKDGDLLMSRSNTRDLVGFAGIYKDIGQPCSYPDLMMRLTPRSGLSSDFLALILNSPPLRRQIQNLASGTSGSMVKISGKIVRSLIVSIPSMEAQHRAVSTISAVDEVIDDSEDVRDKLLLLKQGLMSDLLNGHVRVPLEAAS